MREVHGEKGLGVTAFIPEGLEPLGVWDCGDRSSAYWTAGWQETSAWAQAHIHGAVWTTRVEFYLLDAAFAVVHRLAVGENGKPYMDPETGEAAMDAPAVVPLAELPPAHLLGG